MFQIAAQRCPEGFLQCDLKCYKPHLHSRGDYHEAAQQCYADNIFSSLALPENNIENLCIEFLARGHTVTLNAVKYAGEAHVHRPHSYHARLAYSNFASEPTLAANSVYGVVSRNGVWRAVKANANLYVKQFGFVCEVLVDAWRKG